MADAGDQALRQDSLRDHVCQCASLQVLHDDPQLVADQIALDVVDDVAVLRLVHHLDLRDNQLLLGLMVEIHLLNGYQLSRVYVACLAHGARRSGVSTNPRTIKYK